MHPPAFGLGSRTYELIIDTGSRYYVPAPRLAIKKFVLIPFMGVKR
jgi:hypothetical protein